MQFTIASSKIDEDTQRFTQLAGLVGGYSGEGTPDPISNSEVKLSSADGTTTETSWESRSLPTFLSTKKPLAPFIGTGGFLAFLGRKITGEIRWGTSLGWLSMVRSRTVEGLRWWVVLLRLPEVGGSCRARSLRETEG